RNPGKKSKLIRQNTTKLQAKYIKNSKKSATGMEPPRPLGRRFNRCAALKGVVSNQSWFYDQSETATLGSRTQSQLAQSLSQALGTL
ncbi:MAG: hypothetical protein FWH15_08570, partial [Betaproteobacteria bacterium]|nr:hypothetical protein [Betaproteobacteria bacterium]